MTDLNWIKELVISEQNFETQGIVDYSHEFRNEKTLAQDTLNYLLDIKTVFIDKSSAFNQFKGSPVGYIKVYSVSKTQADFMLFRNGCKLIFSYLNPGEIGVFFNRVRSVYVPGEGVNTEKTCEAILKAYVGAFDEVEWYCNDRPFKMDSLVRYYMTRFTKESVQ